MTIEIDQKRYEEIGGAVHSDSSPVGIDAKKTHILILKLLLDIDKRLQRLEAGLNNGNSNQ